LVLLLHLNTEQATEPTHRVNRRSTHSKTQQGVQVGLYYHFPFPFTWSLRSWI